MVVGEGDTYEEALADVQSAITFHIETFGAEVMENAASVLEVFVSEAGIAPAGGTPTPLTMRNHPVRGAFHHVDRPDGKGLYQKEREIDILEVRRIALANLPDPDYIGHRAYWATSISRPSK